MKCHHRHLNRLFADALVVLLVMAGCLCMPRAAQATPGVDDYPYKDADTSARDPWWFTCRQCTSFVAWRLNNDNGVAFNTAYLGADWGPANNWIEGAREAGCAVDMNPAVGSVACWVGEEYGHVAWVMAVNGDSVRVEEYNYQRGRYTQRTINRYSPTGYIHIKDLASATRERVVLSNGAYTIQSALGGCVLDVASGSSDNGANVQIYLPNGSAAQTFEVEWNTDTKVNQIRSLSSGKVLDTTANAIGQANVQQWDATGAEGQQWRFEDAGDGWVYIRNLWGYYLDVAGGGTAPGTNVETYSFTGGPAQKWKLVPASTNGQTNTNPVTMYRLYNEWSGEHLYTADTAEYESLATVGWAQEGMAWQSPASSSTPVYRLYNPYSGDHFYTQDKDEYERLGAVGWNQEGVAFFSDDAQGTPIYRLYNPYVSVGTHLFTTEFGEYLYLCYEGWQGEGIAFYGLA